MLKLRVVEQNESLCAPCREPPVGGFKVLVAGAEVWRFAGVVEVFLGDVVKLVCGELGFAVVLVFVMMLW